MYVYEDMDSNRPRRWCVNVNEKDATEILMEKGLPIGTFLIRPRRLANNDTRWYLVSVKEEEEDQPKIIHRVVENPHPTCYIYQPYKFPSMEALILYFKKHVFVSCKLTRQITQDNLPERNCAPMESIQRKAQQVGGISRDSGFSDFEEVSHSENKLKVRTYENKETLQKAADSLLKEGKQYLSSVFPARDDQDKNDEVFLAANYFRQPQELQEKLKKQQKKHYDIWQGFTVRYLSAVPSNEGCFARSHVQSDSLTIGISKMGEMRDVINKNADHLFSQHSNMTMITGSPVKITNFGLKSIHIEAKPTIVIYCLKKHIIPFGEGVFPNKLGKFPVDVREGRTYVHGDEDPSRLYQRSQNLLPGCHVGISHSSGSLGGFVKRNHDNRIGFMTSGHMFLGQENDAIVTGDDRPCGRLDKGIFSNDEASIDTRPDITMWGMDAAFVALDHGVSYAQQIQLTGQEIDDYRDYGMPNPIAFTNSFANLGEISEYTPIFKNGYRTKFTEGQFTFYGTAARRQFKTHKLKSGAMEFVAKNLITVTSNINIHASAVSHYFADKGDSGAFAFIVERGRPQLVGIVTGFVDDNCFLLVPLEPVVKYFGVSIIEQ